MSEAPLYLEDEGALLLLEVGPLLRHHDPQQLVLQPVLHPGIQRLIYIYIHINMYTYKYIYISIYIYT